MFEERKVSDDPSPGLSLFETLPLVRVEELVFVGHMEVLTNEAEDLSFGAEGIVTNHNRTILKLYVHFLTVCGV